MSVIVINKSQIADLDLLFLQLWFNALPEVQDRIKIEVGQQRILFPVQASFVARGCALFSERTGGNLIEKVSTRPSVLRLLRGDSVIYTVHWHGF